MSFEFGTKPSKVKGVGEIRDKDGNLKGELVIEAETTLTEEELRELGLPIEQPPSDVEEK